MYPEYSIADSNNPNNGNGSKSKDSGKSYSHYSTASFDLFDFADHLLQKLDAETIYNKFPHNLKFDASGKGRGEPPFHDSKSGTSFTVFPDLGFFDANAGFAGSPIHYIHSLNMGHYEYAKGQDYLTALKELANLAGETLPERELNKEQFARWQKAENRRNLLSNLYEICQETLWTSVGAKALDYLRNRGYDESCDDELKRLQIGFFDDAKRIKKILLDRGFSQQLIKDVLGGVQTFSKWEGYITYPWWDDKNQPLTLYGRYQEKTAPEEKPKTLALHGTGTKRSPYLFNECLANREKDILFVEGINDALTLQIKGDKRICAGVAAQFSGEQWETLKHNRIETIIHVGDPDGGGDNGTKSNVKNGISRGFNVYVAERLPGDYDPDAAVNELGIDWWLDYTSPKKCKHGLTWLAEFICQEYDFYFDEDKVKAYKKLKAEAKGLNADPIMLEMFYWKKLYELMDISPEAIEKLERQFSGANTVTSTELPEQFKPYEISQWLWEKYKTTLAYDTQIAEWRRYEAVKAGVWSIEKPEFIHQVVKSQIESIKECFDNAEITAKLIKEVGELLKWDLSIKKFDCCDRNKIPFKNGVLDLTTHHFEAHSQGNKFTWSLPYDYDPHATCEPIKEWFLSAFEGDADMVELIRAYLYGIISGRTDWHKYIEMIGGGGTGKSTVIRLAEALVGRENVHSTTLKKLEESRFETASIKDKRLVVVTDSERYAGGVSVLKALTGQDSLPYEVKMKQSTGGFIPEAMVLIAGNETIKSSDYTSGLERRRINLPMNNKIPSHKQRQLIEFNQNNEPIGEFAPYINGLFNWVLGIGAGKASQFVKHYETLVPSLVRRKLETLLETNSLADWANEKLVYRPNDFTSIGTKQGGMGVLYGNYCDYCWQVNINPVSQKRFTGLLDDLFKNQLGYTDIYPKRKKTGRGFMGLGIRSYHDSDPCLILDEGDGSVTEGDGSVTGGVTAESPMNTDHSEKGDGCDGLFQKQSPTEEKQKNNNDAKAGWGNSNKASHPSPHGQNSYGAVDSTRHPSRHPSDTQPSPSDTPSDEWINPEIDAINIGDEIWRGDEKEWGDVVGVDINLGQIQVDCRLSFGWVPIELVLVPAYKKNLDPLNFF